MSQVDDIPTSSKDLTAEDINLLHQNLASAYQCPMDDIEYDFQKITDEYDEDREDYIWLVYKLHGREIFTYKMLIPEEIKEMLKYIIKN